MFIDVGELPVLDGDAFAEECADLHDAVEKKNGRDGRHAYGWPRVVRSERTIEWQDKAQGYGREHCPQGNVSEDGGLVVVNLSIHVLHCRAVLA